MENKRHAPRKFFAETREHWPIMSVYERFEQIVAIVLSLVISVVIALALVQLVIRIVPLLLSGAIDPLEHDVFQALFGMIMTLLIAMEFKHSIVRVALRRSSIIQVKTVGGLLTFSINVTLDGCVDHQEGIADDETHAFFTRLMDEGGAMLWGRVTYEMMESYWPAVARGDEEAPPAMREWAVKLEAKPKYVVSSTRKDFPWTNSHHIAGDLRTGVQKLKDATPAGVLLGSGKLATELDRLDLIDEYKFLVHPRIAGHGPTLYQSGLPSTRRLELVSAKPLRSGAVAMHYRQ